MGAWHGDRELAAAKGSSTAGRRELMPVQIQSPLAKGARAAPEEATQGRGEHQAVPGLAQRAEHKNHQSRAS